MATEEAATRAVEILLDYIGEDVDRSGLLDTPSRYVKALKELTAGYEEDPVAILSTQFEEPCDQMVVVTGVGFTSLCEHHILPFTGKAAVAYIPGKKVVGLSKLARVVQTYAKRLQVQERLTREIAEAIDVALEPIGVGVVITATHQCMAIRGVKNEAAMTTSQLIGAMRDQPETRAEFLALARANGNGK
jgi:GTP cyclohydrolase IA